jgi:hypothetical protein
MCTVIFQCDMFNPTSDAFVQRGIQRASHGTYLQRGVDSRQPACCVSCSTDRIALPVEQRTTRRTFNARLSTRTIYSLNKLHWKLTIQILGSNEIVLHLNWKVLIFRRKIRQDRIFPDRVELLRPSMLIGQKGRGMVSTRVCSRV